MFNQPHPDGCYHQEFRHAALGAVNWIEDYLKTVHSRPVAATVSPGEILASLPTEAPVRGEPIEAVLGDLTNDLLPGVTHWNHPRFLAYVPQSATPGAIVADMIVSALNVNGMLWQTSPTLTELEEAVLKWLGKLLGLPLTWFGQIQESASMGTLTALTVARERDRRRNGRRPGSVICSSETHASVDKAVRLLDVPLTVIATDAAGRMSIPQLERELAGRDVSAVVATVGTTSSAAIDPVTEIAAQCRRWGTWLHVDGAYASAAAICPEHAQVLDGIEAADSFVISAHKGLGLTASCACLYTPHRLEFRQTFTTAPDYLAKDEALVNLVDYGPMFSRRLAALKLWVVLRVLGSDGLRERIRAAIELARELALLINEDPDWELCTQNFGVVCFRLRASDQSNLRLLQEVNRDGRVFISGTRLRERLVLRVAIGNHTTRRHDVLTAWRVLREHAQHNIGHGRPVDTEALR